MPGQLPTSPDALDALRERVLRAGVVVLAVSMPLASGLVAAQGLVSGELDLRSLAYLSASGLFPILWAILPRLSFRVAAGVFVGLMVLSALLLASRGVLTAGYAALDLLAILSATLFFGRAGAVAGLGAAMLAHLTGWAMVSFQVGPPPAISMIDPQIPAVWMRHVVVLVALGGGVAVTVLYVVEQLAHEVQVHRRLADLEMQQRVALERAERERAHERDERERAQQALDQARRLEALARMSGGIAHDFNNALTVIIGTADVAKLSLSSPDDVASYLDEIVQAAKRAGELTSQLLTLGRAQIGAREPVDMTDFLARLQGALRRVMPDDVALVAEGPSEPITARADMAGLERAVYNLVLNGRDAMPAGGTITLSCHRETVKAREPLADGTYVVVRVSDTGHGMDAQTLTRIFDPFFTTKSERGGTGLGLATVHAFAKDAGGHVEAASTVGAGTTFTLWLPEQNDAAAPLVPASIVSSTPAAAPAAPRARVLVVEDHTDVRANIVRTLTAHGFRVDQAADGSAALAVLATQRDYAVMCIDGVMPGLATADVLARAAELAPAMAVLVCSGYVREELLRRGVEAGRYAFLAKPFTSEQLLASVDSVLRSAAAPRTAS